MRSADLFIEDFDGRSELNEPLLEKLRRGTASGYDDISAAEGLAELAYDQFEDFGTGGGESLDDKQMTQVVRALEAVTKRLGIEFALPFDNFRRFKSYWLKHDGYGSWLARRDMLDELFDPLTAQVARVEQDLYEDLAYPVSPRSATGWPDVDTEIKELRRRFASCTTPQDYRSLGTYCMGVIESVSRGVQARAARPGRRNRASTRQDQAAPGPCRRDGFARTTQRGIPLTRQSGCHRSAPDQARHGADPNGSRHHL